MKLKLMYLLLCVSSTLFSYAQQKSPVAISAAGGISKSENIILEWTVGESFIQTISTFSKMYTQGFHQPILNVDQIIRTKEDLVNKHSLQVFPNPVTAILNIELGSIPTTPMYASLVDANGRMIMNQQFANNSKRLMLDVRRFVPGTYFLRINSPGGVLVGEYKVIKAPAYSTNKTF